MKPVKSHGCNVGAVFHPEIITLKMGGEGVEMRRTYRGDLGASLRLRKGSPYGAWKNCS